MSETSSRGGMCANPFGGEDRIDRVNLLEYLTSNAPAEKVLYSRIIQDAASNYLYAFLGKNGTSTEEFFAAWMYFFKVMSTDRVTWDHHRTIRHSYTSRGHKIHEARHLTDGELQKMCFDKHYEMSGLSNHMHIEKFREGLKKKRREILTANWEQVKAYVDSLYQSELAQIADGQQVPLQIWGPPNWLMEILIDPPSPCHLAGVLYVPAKLKKFRTARAQRAARRAQRKVRPPVEGQQFFNIEGVANDQAVHHDSNNSICRNSA